MTRTAAFAGASHRVVPRSLGPKKDCVLTRMEASEDIQRQATNALDSLLAIKLALSVRRVIADGCTLTDAELQAIISVIAREPFARCPHGVAFH
jgi:hypothetical protein